jgi:hypothetical protein
VKISTPKRIFRLAAVAAVMCFDVPASQAQVYGDAPWCAVIDQGASNPTWECEYASVADCMPLVIGGNRGFCQHNPYWHPDPPPPAPPASQTPFGGGFKSSRPDAYRYP